MITFGFVSNLQLRELLERDYTEMLRCLESGASKSKVILAGSIIEATLADYFLRFGTATITSSEAQILRMDLNELLNLARDENTLTSQTIGICHAIRGYRNLIHPGMELRRQRSADKDTATVCIHLVNIIARELSDAFANKAGHQAEMALALFLDDPSSESRADFVIAAMDLFERRKLFKIIPDAITERINTNGWTTTELRLARIHERLKRSVDRGDVDRELVALRTALLTNSPTLIASRMALFPKELHQLDEQTRTALADFIVDAFQRSDLPLVHILSRRYDLGDLGPFIEATGRATKLIDVVFTNMIYGLGITDELLVSVGELTSGMSSNTIEHLKSYVGSLAGSHRRADAERLQNQIGVPF